MAKSRKELDKDLLFQKIMPALSENPFSDLHGQEDGAAQPAEEAADAQVAFDDAAESASGTPAAADANAVAVPEHTADSPVKDTPEPTAAAALVAGAASPEPAPSLVEEKFKAELAAAQAALALPPLEDAQDDDLSALRSRLFSHNSFDLPQESVCTLNVTESLVRKNADGVMRRFNCCSCDRCRCDVITETLNFLPPHYVTGDLSLLAPYEAELPEKDIVAALVRAVLQIRAHPNH